jgi:hypothetical protein
MTHPLTDEICLDLMSDRWGNAAFLMDMRAAADWQLEQCIAWLDAADCDDPRVTPQGLREAMRPQEDN